MSLRLRLSLAFAIGTAALIAVSGLVFLAQLHSSLNSAIDATLQARSEALAAGLRSGSLPRAAWPASGQLGQQTGQHSGADEFAQVLTPNGKVIFPSWADENSPLLPVSRLRQAEREGLTMTAMVEGEQVRMLAREVHQARHPVIVIVGAVTSVADAAQARARTVILIGGPVVVISAGLGAWLLTGAALSPVHQMRRRLEEISEHDSSARLEVPSTGDEIASLAATTNRLLDRLQDALSRQRGFVADAGHELRTPLTALKAELDLAARPGKSRDALASAVAAAADDTDRLIRLAEDLLLLARADDGTAFIAVERTDLSALISASARSFAAQAGARGITLAVNVPQRLTAVADPARLRQALGNLIENAIGHAPAGTAVELSSDARHVADDGCRRRRHGVVSIEVRDHGPGFPVEFLPRAFERFSRADPARDRDEGGAGLGLAIVASIAAAHGGRAVAGNHPGGGACVQIELPLGD